MLARYATGHDSRWRLPIEYRIMISPLATAGPVGHPRACIDEQWDGVSTDLPINPLLGLPQRDQPCHSRPGGRE